MNSVSKFRAYLKRAANHADTDVDVDVDADADADADADIQAETDAGADLTAAIYIPHQIKSFPTAEAETKLQHGELELTNPS